MAAYGLYTGRHGLRDYSRLRGQVLKAQERSAAIEKENQLLRTRLKSLEASNDLVRERELREFLGWVKSEEWVYLERSRQ